MSGDQFFDTYEEEFLRAARVIDQKIRRATELTGEAKKSVIAEAERALEDVDRLVRQMGLEARSMAPPLRHQLLNKVKVYEQDTARLKTDLRNARAVMPDPVAAREQLFQGSPDYPLFAQPRTSTSEDQRARLLANTDRLQRTTERLEESKRQMVQTEELGVSVLGDLHGQRGTIIHARDTLRVADDNISKSRRILRSMARRVVTNKIIMCFIILVLLIVIGLVVYIKMR